uniref:Uncharacterized protein n=1 Tax=Gopherus evgoodei TaxID=1825980 RepID=A0A8C4WQV0_9SAUR
MVQIVISSDEADGLAEWVLMELQGEIEARYSTRLAGNLLGDLHYTREVRELSLSFLQAWESSCRESSAKSAPTKAAPGSEMHLLVEGVRRL